MIQSSIIVTGAGGYLGHCVVRELTSKGYFTVAVDTFPRGTDSLAKVLKSKGCIIRCNVLDEIKFAHIFQKYKPNICIHLAALVGEALCDEDEDLAWAVNRDSAVTAARLSRFYECSAFALISTCSVYGIRPGQKSTENDCVEPVTTYARSKLGAERFVLAESNVSFRTIIFRLSTLFGCSERMRFDLLVNQFVAEAHLLKRINVFDPNTRRPYLHVRDAARAIVTLTVTGGCETGIVNVGDGRHNYSKEQIIAHIKRLYPQTRVMFSHRRKDRRDYSVDFAKVASRGFHGSVSVETGMLEISDFLSDYGTAIDISSEQWKATRP